MTTPPRVNRVEFAVEPKGHHILVRVGANVSLLTELTDGNLDKGKMIVMSWPQEAIKAGRPPLRLRLVKVRVGKTWMWLLSSVLDQNKLNVKQLRNILQTALGNRSRIPGTETDTG